MATHTLPLSLSDLPPAPTTVPASIPRYIIPDLPQAIELLPYLQRIDANRWYSNFGPLVMEFEQHFCAAMAASHGDKAGAYHAFAAMTGYHALVIGLKLLGIGPGKRVLLPAVTFPACPLSVQHLGATPVLSDVDTASWTLTPAIARAAAARQQIDAVMPVAVYGIPLPAAEWDQFTEATGIPVLIDAAAAVESQRYLKHGLVVHSLHALKPFGIGEGGLLISARSDDIFAARDYANFGTRNRITYSFGENAKLSEYHAAVGLAQLRRWSDIKQRRAQLYAQFKDQAEPYRALFALHPGLDQAIVSCLMFRLAKPYTPDQLARIRLQGIFAHHTYLPPLYRHPHFSDVAVTDAEGYCLTAAEAPARLPVAEALNQTVLGLPFHAFLPPDDIARSLAALAEACKA
jgi:dTDP-4-amino-4,6-dideoxygalactose transaminase